MEPAPRHDRDEMEQIMIYELRIYRCVPGRLPALLSRFQNDTLRIWEKHGIRQAGFWTTLIGESNEQLTCLLGTPWLSARSAGAHSSPTPNGKRPSPRPRRTAHSYRTSAASCWRQRRFPR
jgi:hypothetical protein